MTVIFPTQKDAAENPERFSGLRWGLVGEACSMMRP